MLRWIPVAEQTAEKVCEVLCLDFEDEF